ncbi:MAG: hypothetical protein KC994_21550, partial [Candidatus Omnitrophica bacterium]|nr:hypothetical protein [Candidatus Omnitrophota bacterium]
MRKSLKWLFLSKHFLLLITIACSTAGWAETQISRHGITWTLEGSPTMGQFANGDYWVIGPVNVLSASPAPTGSRNGSMINPMPGKDQAFDARVNDFVSSQGVVFPRVIQPDESLVSTESNPNENECGSTSTSWESYFGCTRSILKRGAVLTVLKSSPTEESFRPPYCGTDKSLTPISEIQWDLLPSLPAPFGKPSLSNYERTFERVWIDHKTGWDGAYLHPSENMHNYGREISLDTGIASLVLMLDYPQEQKETLLIR